MLRSSIFKYIVAVVLAVTLSACAGFTSLVQDNPAAVVYPTPLIEPLPYEAVFPLEEPEFEVAVVEKAIPLVPLNERAVVRITPAEVKCMADNMYFEARGEGDVGMIAVGYVVLNRIADRRFSHTSICGIVYDRVGGCQFSWTCNGSSRAIRNKALYARIETLAQDVMRRAVDNPVDDSIFFRHRSRTQARHSVNQLYRASIGNHRFFASRT